MSGTFSFVSFWMSSSDGNSRRRDVKAKVARPPWLPPEAQAVELGDMEGWFIPLDNMNMMGTMNMIEMQDPAHKAGQQEESTKRHERLIRKRADLYACFPEARGFVRAEPHGWVPLEWQCQKPEQLRPDGCHDAGWMPRHPRRGRSSDCKYCEISKQFAIGCKNPENKFAPYAPPGLCAICAFWKNQEAASSRGE